MLLALGEVRNHLLAIAQALDDGALGDAADKTLAVRKTFAELALCLERASGAQPPRPASAPEAEADPVPAARTAASESTDDPSVLDPDRLAAAVRLSSTLHASQRRKGTTVPYSSHLIAVAALVMEDDGDEDQVVAALLHDAVEDQGGLATLEEIRARFGERVGGIGLACSDATPAASEAKPPWRERKTAFVQALATMPADALLIVAATSCTMPRRHSSTLTLSAMRCGTGSLRVAMASCGTTRQCSASWKSVCRSRDLLPVYAA